MQWIKSNSTTTSRQTISRWEREGRIVKIDRGLYVPADEADRDHLSLAAAALRHPKGVLCLVSALRFHGIGTQVPRKIWVAVPRGSSSGQPQSTRQIRLLRWMPRYVTEDIEVRSIADVPVRITTPARTIIDCWRCPRLISRETAIEAMREGIAHGLSRAILAKTAKRYGLRAIISDMEMIA